MNTVYNFLALFLGGAVPLGFFFLTMVARWASRLGLEGDVTELVVVC